MGLVYSFLMFPTWTPVKKTKNNHKCGEISHTWMIWGWKLKYRSILKLLVPSRRWVHIPTCGKGKSSTRKCRLIGDMLVPLCYQAFHWTNVEHLAIMTNWSTSFVSMLRFLWSIRLGLRSATLFHTYCASWSDTQQRSYLNLISLKINFTSSEGPLSYFHLHWNTATTSLGLIVSVVPTAMFSQATWHVITELCHNMS